VKEGVVHVHPPVPVLERMIAARLSLDDCGHYDGALRVLPGTHRRGRLDAATIRRCARDIPAATCPAAAGDLLLMRPLLLHASSPAARPVRRRVLHVEFAREPLPPGLEWLPVSP
jgi:ectoine hydroxylase-related dioxygenase (phytanoyl-CoA dioxygenase family)